MPAKYRVEITVAAQRDIAELWEFIAQDKPLDAERFIEALEKQILKLECLPLRCPVIPESEILGGEYRHLLHGDYRTLFRVIGKTVYVLRVIHGAMLLQEL